MWHETQVPLLVESAEKRFLILFHLTSTLGEHQRPEASASARELVAELITL